MRILVSYSPIALNWFMDVTTNDNHHLFVSFTEACNGYFILLKNKPKLVASHCFQGIIFVN